MDYYDIIGELRTYADNLGWHFLYGDSFMRNYEITKKDIIVNDLILGTDPFIATPTFTNAGKVLTISYTGLIMLGRKFELNTTSSLDETTIQKYDRRLFELTNLLSTNLISFACANDLTINNVQFELGLNQLDENLDFVIGSVTLLQG